MCCLQQLIGICFESRCEKKKERVAYSNSVMKSVQYDIMVDRVERCREVKENKCGDFAAVGSIEKVGGDWK